MERAGGENFPVASRLLGRRLREPLLAIYGVAPRGVPGLEEVRERAGGENSPVASRLLGRRLREPLLAIYGFARLVDQVGDESPGDRPALLDWLDSQIDRMYAGTTPDHPALRRMAVTARRGAISPQYPHPPAAGNRGGPTTSSLPTLHYL